MGGSCARPRMVGEAILCPRKAFGNQTYDSTRSTQWDNVCQGKLDTGSLLVLVFHLRISICPLLQVYPPAPRNVLTILQPKLLMFSIGKR